MQSDTQPQETPVTDARKVFKQLGTCSRTFFHLLNREFGHLKDAEERAAGALAGGIMQKGHQCGMLWGCALAVGAEAYRKSDNLDEAIAVAIQATQKVMTSFVNREETIDCRDITHCNFENRLSFAKYMLSRRFRYCFKMAQEWAPDAIAAARKGLVREKVTMPCALSCATEVARKMGASDEELVMVAGFAGGLGLSGGGCGALAAAIWMKSLAWCREHPKASFKNPEATATLEAFLDRTNDRIMCSEITGRWFDSTGEHSDFLHKGGCATLINTLTW